MGCRSDYMNPTDAEKQSHKVARRIVFVEEKLGKKTLEKIKTAAMNPYGWKDGIHEMTAHLCSTLKSLTPEKLEEIVYDAHSSDSRKLADWWEQHLEDDKRHEREDHEEAEKIRLMESAAKKLTPEERKTLGL